MNITTKNQNILVNPVMDFFDNLTM